jgi:hypothetical protein
MSQKIIIKILPEGLWFSLSGLSPESEKKNQLCALCVSSEAGGEIIAGNT